MENIIVKKSYFDNIEAAINSLNAFFASNFKTKNFPVTDGDFEIDGSIMKILGLMNGVEAGWIDDTEKVEKTINAINDIASEFEEHPYEHICSSNDAVTIDHIDAFVSFKALQFIADHFEQFTELVNGIYSMELFTKPSAHKSVIDLFSQDINLSEIEGISEDIHTPIFDGAEYIRALFESDQIQMPKGLNPEDEIKRFYNYQDLVDVSIVVDEAIQEAAQVNYFDKTKPKHIKYDEKKDKFHISTQLQKIVNQLVDGLEKCDTTDDLLRFFSDKKSSTGADDFAENILPFVLAKVFNSEKKYPQKFDTKKLQPYIESYKSIADQNPGAKRFINYDLFSTFKVDKEGTINFIKDFCTLDLYNSSSAAITNNTLLTIFNIFDSRIYFDILYNLIPDKVKKSKYPSEDEFVKQIRARINKNSRTTNTYKPDNKAAKDNNIPDTEEVMEYTNAVLKEFGDMSISDMMYCEQYRSILRDEINTLDARIFNEGLSPIRIDYMLKPHKGSIKDVVFQETDKGEIPDYMKTRIRLSDDMGTSPKVTQTEVQVPPDTPDNSVDELTDSVDARMDINSDDIGDMLGADAKVPKNGTVIYNVTNNYNNSFNRDDHSTHTTKNDLSSGKNVNNSRTVTNTTTNTNSHNTTNTGSHPAKGYNNTNNSNGNVDTKDSGKPKPEDVQEFASGYSVGDVFAFLESEEPLSTFTEATDKPPKGDLLSTAMDVDRKTRSAQQKAKRTVQKSVSSTKALLKPATRTKQWLAGVVDSLVQRNEDKVKSEIIESPSYRTTLFKATRLALKLGMTGIAFTINGYLGAAYVALQVSRAIDKERLKKEVQGEMAAEMRILDDKIRKAEEAGDYKEKWQMMRLRSKMERIVVDTPRSTIKHTNSVV